MLQVKIHGLLLSAASPFLSNIFSTTFSPNLEHMVLLPGVAAHTVASLCQLLYGATVLISRESLVQLYRLIDILAIQLSLALQESISSPAEEEESPLQTAPLTSSPSSPQATSKLPPPSSPLPSSPLKHPSSPISLPSSPVPKVQSLQPTPTSSPQTSSSPAKDQVAEPPVKMLKIDDKNDISDASYPVAEEEVNTSCQGDSMLPVCCWHCSQDFPSFPQLSEHVRTSHQGQGRPGQRRHHRCARCGTVLSSMWKLRQHLASHHQPQAQERGAGKESVGDHQYGRSSRSARAVVRRQGGDHGYATAKEIAGGRVEELATPKNTKTKETVADITGASVKTNLIHHEAEDTKEKSKGHAIPKEATKTRGESVALISQERLFGSRKDRISRAESLTTNRTDIPNVNRKKVLTFANCGPEEGGGSRLEEKTPPGSAVCSEHSYGTKRDSSPELDDSSPPCHEASDHMYSSAKSLRMKREENEGIQHNQPGNHGYAESTSNDTEEEGDDYSTRVRTAGVADHQYSQERSSPRLRRILPKGSVTQELIQETQANEVGLHPCLSCGKSFPQAYRLKRHIREVHDKEKLYRCNECEKEFFKSTSLIRHKISVHEKVRPFGCPNCESRFKDRSALKYHTRKKVCSAKVVRASN